MDRNAADYDRYHGPDSRPAEPETISVTVELDAAEVASCIASALRSHTYGVGYWAEVHESDDAVRERESYNASKEACDPAGPWLPLDDETIKRGLAVLAKKYPQHFGRLLDGEGDGPLGDLLIQCALFGEERYA